MELGNEVLMKTEARRGFEKQSGGIGVNILQTITPGCRIKNNYAIVQN